MKAFVLGVAGALGVCAWLPLGAVAADAPSASGAPPASATAPDWVRTASPANCPDGRSARYYPPRAQALGRKGSAVIKCVVTDTGSVDHCVVVSEDPPGYGFGEAALQMSCLFKMKPKTPDGRAVSGAEVTIPLKFDLN